MRSVGNREKSVLDRRWWWALCAAWGIMLVTTHGDRAMACNAYSVKMFVATTEALAETSSDKSLSLCENTSYYVRVEWNEGGSDDEFDVEVREEVDGSSEEIASESGIEDEESSPQSEILLVNTSPYANALDAGKHSIYARVRRDDMNWQPEGNTDDSNCTVYEMGLYALVRGTESWWTKKGTSVLEGDHLWFKAVPNPPELETMQGADWPSGYPQWGGEASWVTPGTDGAQIYFPAVGTKTVSAEVCGTTKSLTVYVKEALFIKDSEQDYGFDNWTDPQLPYKSVKLNAEDTAKAETSKTPVTSLYFKSDDPTDVELTLPASPYHAENSPETVKVKGKVNGGDANIEANWGSVGGTNLAKMPVNVYPSTTKTVLIKRVKLPGETVGTPFSAETLQGYLNGDVYDQCAMQFTVTLSASTEEVDYDNVTGGDGNGKLTYDNSDESDEIIAEATEGLFDFYMFVVKDITDAPDYAVGGFAVGIYSFIEEDEGPRVAAHEIGHGFGLSDIWDEYEDDENLMSNSPTRQVGAKALREDQWDTVN